MTHRTAAIVALVGGLAVAAGSFLPWATITSGLGSVNLPGTQGDGKFTIMIGAAIALLALISLDKAPTSVRTGIVLLGAAAAGIGLLAISNLSASIEDVSSSTIVPSIGYGLFLVVGGGAAAAIGGSQMSSEQPAASVGDAPVGDVPAVPTGPTGDGWIR